MNKIKTVIAGMCGIRAGQEQLYFDLGKELYDFMKDFPDVLFIYKCSFDKANRSSITGERGVGLEKATKIFGNMKEKIPDIQLCTDFHEAWQPAKLKDIITVGQAPAFLGRQSDLLVALAENFQFVNLKKPQWLNFAEISQGIDKVKSVSNDIELWLCDRGTTGNGGLFINFREVPLYLESYDRTLLDCTHSTQYVKTNGMTGGSVDLGIKYLRSSKIFEYQGIFVETIPNPEDSISDKDSIIPTHQLLPILEEVLSN